MAVFTRRKRKLVNWTDSGHMLRVCQGRGKRTRSLSRHSSPLLKTGPHTRRKSTHMRFRTRTWGRSFMREHGAPKFAISFHLHSAARGANSTMQLHLSASSGCSRASLVLPSHPRSYKFSGGCLPFSLLSYSPVSLLICTQQTIKLSSVSFLDLGSYLASRFWTKVGEKR